MPELERYMLHLTAELDAKVRRAVDDFRPMLERIRAVANELDRVNPNLAVLTTSILPGERYSFEFDGNAQALDHALITAPEASNPGQHA